MVVEQLPFPTVRVGGEREVERRDGLTLGDRVHEGVLAHRRERVVGAALLADGRLARGGKILATRRTRTVGREDTRRVRQGQELVVHRVVEHPGELVSGPTDGSEQVRPTDVADEQGVAGQHPPRIGIVGVLPDHDRHRLGRVARRQSDLENHLAQHQPLTLVQALDREVGPCGLAEGDDGAGRRRELEVAGHEVGVEVRLEDAFDAQTEPFGVGEVLRDVPLGVDDHGATRRLVADQVAEQRETTELVLLEDHGAPLGGRGQASLRNIFCTSVTS